MQKTVVHLITGLGKGGAETMLYQLLAHKVDPDIKHVVVNMGGGSYYEQPLRVLGVEVIRLSFKKRPISSFFKLKELLKTVDVLSCFMYHANFVGYLVGRRAKVKRIIWNVRHSEISKQLNNGVTLKINKWCAKRSDKVYAVAFNGEKAKEAHFSIGYSERNAIVLNNGVDVDEYKPDEKAREQICNEFNIASDKKIILSVARNHPIKDVPTFIKAYGELYKEDKSTLSIICGNGIDGENRELTDLIMEYGLTLNENVFLLGLRSDVNKLMAGADVYVLHSAGEAFPNVLVQAMASEKVCITTDVGDAKVILGDDNFVIEPSNVDALAQKIKYALSLTNDEKEKIGKSNRQRVLGNYRIQNVVKEYEKIYKENE